jgi:hypothetical protein
VEAVVGDGSTLDRGLVARNSGLTALHNPWPKAAREPGAAQDIAVNLVERSFGAQGVASKGVKDHLMARGRHGADVTKNFEGSAVAGRLEAVHAPNVVRRTPLKAVDEAVPNLAFVAPMVVVGGLAGSTSCGGIGSGLHERAGGI